MWSKSIGIIILLKIACVSIRGDDETTTADSTRADNDLNWIAKKEYKLMFDRASWYTANRFCGDSGMQLASINSPEEHRYLTNLIQDKYIVDQPFWISKTMVAVESTANWMDTSQFPSFSKRESSSNQCISWYWMNTELCLALWPLANEWNHGHCDEEKYFICERTHGGENELLRVIETELLALVDELMFTGFAEALSTTSENTWVSLVQGALQNWLAEQQQISKPITLLDEQVSLMASELEEIGNSKDVSFEIDDLQKYVNMKFEKLNDEVRVQLLSERFRKFIGDEYVNLGVGTKWSKSPSDGDIAVLVKRVLTLAKVQEIKLASEELSKISETSPTDVLDEDFLKSIAQQLLKFSENEFESYVMNVMAELEVLGVEEVEMNMLLQLYLLVKQELFSLISKTILKATSTERLEIVNYGLSRILEGKQLIEDDSVFGQIFVMLGTGTAVLSEEKTVTGLDDVLLRTFVKQEFDDLRHEDMMALKYEGYMKFIIDEIIKLVGDINLAKNDAGELLVNNVVDLIATQFLFYAEDELKTVAERLAESIEGESNKLQTVVEEMKVRLRMYDEDKILDLIQFVQQELFAIIVQSLVNFTENEMTELAEEGFTKILAENRPIIGKRSIFERAFIVIEKELLKYTADEFALLNDEELTILVKSLFERENYERSSALFEEVYMNLIAEEFVKLIEAEAVVLSAREEQKHQFGEIVRLLAEKLLEFANNESIYLR